MWRKTRRVSKKRRRYTKKRRNVKRTHKYKFLRGGLGVNDYANIGIRDVWSFNDATKIEEFKTYVFGTEEHAEAWIAIMTACKEKNIPFYILTSGSKVGIIRTLQLLGLSELVTEVLCNNRKHNSSNPINEHNPIRNTFKDKNKYDIIKDILAEEYKKTTGDTTGDSTASHLYTGIFVDNDFRNGLTEHNNLCPNVEFMIASGKQVRILDKIKFPQRSFFEFIKKLSTKIDGFYSLWIELYEYKNTNLVDIELLHRIIDKIDTEEINCFFSDFDGTMSPWRSALPFYLPTFYYYFNNHFHLQ
jgi:hypothetical protein